LGFIDDDLGYKASAASAMSLAGAFGRMASMVLIRAAAAHVCCAEFVMKLPQ
jgi:hypothetical protein